MKWTDLILLIFLINLFGCRFSSRDVRPVETQQKVDAGGHRVRLLVTGEGTPTVVLESGLGAGIESWTRVQPSLSRSTQVVSYDQAGVGGSEPSPKPRTGRHIASELHTALKNAGLRPPYVLVGHSIGGPYIHVFANMYPTEVAGLVFVDPTQESFSQGNADLTGWLRDHHPETLRHMEDQFEKAKLPEGIRDFLRVQWADVMKRGEEILASAPTRLRDQWASILNKEKLEMMREESLQSFASMPQAVGEGFQGMLSTLEQAQAAWPLPNVCVIVLANSKRDTRLAPAEQALEAIRIEARLNQYREWLRRVPTGKLIVTEKSGHYVQNDEPELVISAIRQVIESTKR